MGKDIFFEFRQVNRLNLQQQTELASTLLPLKVLARRGKSNVKGRLARHVRYKNMLKQAVVFHSKWRARQDIFRDLTTTPRRNGDEIVTTSLRCRNCKPAFFPTNGRRLYCNVAICPYCHARRVYRYFKQLANLLHQRQFTGVLVWRRVKSDFVQDVGSALAAAFNAAKSAGKRYVARVKSLGAISYVRIEPGYAFNDFSIVTDQLLYYGNAGAIPADATHLEVLTDIKLSTANRLLCRVLRYPPQWVYRDPYLTLRAFTVMRDRNLITTAGVFYSMQKEEIDGFSFNAIDPIYRKTKRRKLGDKPRQGKTFN